MFGNGILGKVCFVPVFGNDGSPCVEWADLANMFPGLTRVDITDVPRQVVFLWKWQCGVKTFYAESQFLCKFDGKHVKFRLNILNDFTVAQVKPHLGEALQPFLPGELVDIVKGFVGVCSANDVW